MLIVTQPQNTKKVAACESWHTDTTSTNNTHTLLRPKIVIANCVQFPYFPFKSNITAPMAPIYKCLLFVCFCFRLQYSKPDNSLTHDAGQYLYIIELV